MTTVSRELQSGARQVVAKSYGGLGDDVLTVTIADALRKNGVRRVAVQLNNPEIALGSSFFAFSLRTEPERLPQIDRDAVWIRQDWHGLDWRSHLLAQMFLRVCRRIGVHDPTFIPRKPTLFWPAAVPKRYDVWLPFFARDRDNCWSKFWPRVHELRGVLEVDGLSVFQSTSKLRIGELLEALLSCRVVVAFEDGVHHLASALDLPCVFIVGRNLISQFAAYENDTVVTAPDDFSCEHLKTSGSCERHKRPPCVMARIGRRRFPGKRKLLPLTELPWRRFTGCMKAVDVAAVRAAVHAAIEKAKETE